ncbi:MAG TPA: hypothetical protein VFK47_15330, partial [Ktedonobacteraceae bacterium]|nr:hypothetical protein [Ktedonobacteraceae bacterium]
MGLTIFSQNTNGIANPSPAGLAPIPGPFTNQFQRTDTAYDYAIGGIPFISGESQRGTYFRKIYVRSFSPIRKDQFDNQQVPGEQSIWGWWLRSQSAFDEGAGVQFLDTSVDPTFSHRYFYSESLDMFGTPGQVTLLSKTTNDNSGSLATIGPVKLRGVTRSGADGVLVFDTGARTLKFFSTAGAIVNYTMPAAIAAASIMNTLTDDGTNYYLMTSAGIFKGSIVNNG